MMDPEFAVDTLGLQLDAAGRRLSDAHLVSVGWLPAVIPVLSRLARLEAGHAGRFEREETPRRDRPTQTDGQPPRWPSRSRPPVPSRAPGPGDPQERSGRALPADVRGLLRDVAGPGADSMRVHDSGVDQLAARAEGGDAVTWGTDVYLAGGPAHVEDASSVGLLAHEAIHVAAAADPAALVRRHSPGGMAHEESQALRAELAVRETSAWPVAGLSTRPQPSNGWSTSRHGSRMPTGGSVPGVTPASGAPSLPAGPSLAPAGPAASARSGGGAVAMHASPHRELPAPPAPVDVDALRRDIMADLMSQLRVESERGG